MPGPTHRLEELRREALAATRGLSEGQQALVDALRDLQAERGRAADGYRAVVESLAAALEARDGYTGDHSDEVQLLAAAVAARLGFDEAAVAELHAVAILHDVGKIGIPDRILHKPGPLDDEEWALMREHPLIGELAEWNMTAVPAVASRDASGCWLVEVFADERSTDPGVIEPVARVLTVHGLYDGVPADLSRSRAISAAARADTFA